MGSKLHDLLDRHGVAADEHPEFELLDEDTQREMVTLIAQFLRDHELATATLGERTTYRELELDLTAYKIPYCDFGTADRVDVIGSTAWLFDYKFGQWAVTEAEMNIQLWLYALGVFYRFKAVKTVNVYILQPALDTVSEAAFTREDMERMLLRALTIADRVKETAGKIHTPVFSNCLWCANKAHCPALAKLALAAAPEIMPEWPSNISFAPDNLTDEVVLDHGSVMYDWAKLMESWGESMKRRITNLVIDGAEIRGKQLRIVAGGSNVMDVKEAVRLTAEKAGVEPIEIYEEFASISLGSLKDCVKSKAPQGSKGKTEEELAQLLRTSGVLYTKGPSKYLVDVKAAK